jgi:hypothetical protein
VTTSRTAGPFYTDPDYSPDIAEWDRFLHRFGVAYKSELARRTVFESELFGMNTYIIMSHLDDYLHLPGRMLTIAESMDPRLIVERLGAVGSKCNFITSVAFILHYFAGRELWIDLGKGDRGERTDDHLAVLNFWRRATIAQRRDGVLLNIDAQPPDSSRLLGDDVIADIVDDVIPIEEYGPKGMRRFSAQATAYCFLENCDSRQATCDTGPYPVKSGGSFLAVREIMLDKEGDFPWLDGLREKLRHHHYVIAYELPDSVHMSNNVFGTSWMTPVNYLDHVRRVRVYSTDTGELVPLAPDEVGDVRAEIKQTHRELYQRFSEMSVRERTTCAAQMYAWKIKPWARAAGVYDDIDWSLDSGVLDLYDELADDERSLALLGNVFVPPHRDSVWGPLS